MSSEEPLIERTASKMKASTTTIANATPGSLVGLVAHGRIGLVVGALISAALWPSLKAFLINVAEWVLRGIQRRLRIPFVAPSPYPLPPVAALDDDVPDFPTPPELTVTKVPTAVG